MGTVKKNKKIQVLGPLEEEMDFFFSNFFGSSYPSLYRKELCWRPATDVYEIPDAFVVTLELAQINPKEVTITFQEGVLQIRGIRKAVPTSERRRYHKMEINYGPFEQKIPIPDDVDVDDLSAHYREGFLEIRLPKKQHNSIGTININVD
jgi:HSP20 family protein